MYEWFDLGDGTTLRIAKDLLAKQGADREAFIKREVEHARVMRAETK